VKLSGRHQSRTIAVALNQRGDLAARLEAEEPPPIVANASRNGRNAAMARWVAIVVVGAGLGLSGLPASGLPSSTSTAACTTLQNVSEDIDSAGRIAPSITPAQRTELASEIADVARSSWPSRVRAALRTMKSAYTEFPQDNERFTEFLVKYGHTFQSSAAHVHAYATANCAEFKPNTNVPFGGEKAEIAKAFMTWIGSHSVDATANIVDGGERLRDTITKARREQSVYPQIVSGRIDAVTLQSSNRARVTYLVLLDGQAVSLRQSVGTAVKTGADWKVSRDTYCASIARLGGSCPS
jgi:hypothetical protein